MDAHTLLKIETALIKHDEGQKRHAARNKRGYYNPHALSIYLRALGDAKDEHREEGKSIHRALWDNFQGALLDDIEKALDLPRTRKGKKDSLPRPA